MGTVSCINLFFTIASHDYFIPLAAVKPEADHSVYSREDWKYCTFSIPSLLALPQIMPFFLVILNAKTVLLLLEVVSPLRVPC